MERLQTECDCDSLEQAEKKLKQLQASAEKAKKKFENRLEEFQEKWEDVLDG